ncbi:carbohydrate-binding module family 20 protein [Botryobasidium botryosum FD-172 SS1]|uniref:Glucoamylase n=1 Tax=Botryobasidium botryosum (strain FD-172 SS1) TaxID=930990 RepID=A0A067MTT2_BOTB1|nr:carbohydrate-binding module family 20 protein [Botryobasidium botryosum FD-172 SS1]
MKFQSLLAALPLVAAPFASAKPLPRAAADVSSFITSEGPIAYAGIMNNIGPTGSKSLGAKAGVVIAAPSTSPDYRYEWIRDSSLVFKLLVDTYTSGGDQSLNALTKTWIESQGRIQQLTNPSGSLSTGGLGEPKFQLNETAFEGPWGRPQRDGPALRSTAMISFANYLFTTGESSYVTTTIWPIVQLDLDYVQNNWNMTGFDLWEEVDGSSFFTSAAQHRALREGAALATKLGDSARATSYTEQAGNILCFLQAYWNPSGSYIVSNINTQVSRTGIDINSVLTAIHIFDAAAGCDAATFQPCSDQALANHYAVVNSFRSIYGINSNQTGAVAIGRYAEDVYYNGNPWYLATFAAAEQLYQAIYQWKTTGSIPVTSISLNFFQQLFPSAQVGSYASSSSEFQTIVGAVQDYADEFVAIVAKYVGTNGALSEQFDRNTGAPLSAADLTWSYASALTAFNARAGKFSPTWGASGLTPPSVCGTKTVARTPVTFRLSSQSDNAFLVGSIDVLKAWNASNAIPMTQSTYPNWAVTVDLPVSTTLQYKYIRKSANGTVTWLSDPNNNLTTPASGPYTVTDVWR